eukprot:15459040-Alexandrium_andersonii.AAC.2
MGRPSLLGGLFGRTGKRRPSGAAAPPSLRDRGPGSEARIEGHGRPEPGLLAPLLPQPEGPIDGHDPASEATRGGRVGSPREGHEGPSAEAMRVAATRVNCVPDAGEGPSDAGDSVALIALAPRRGVSGLAEGPAQVLKVQRPAGAVGGAVLWEQARQLLHAPLRAPAAAMPAPPPRGWPRASMGNASATCRADQ